MLPARIDVTKRQGLGDCAQRLWRLTVIGALRCVSGVAGDVEYGAHDGHIGGVRRAVAYGSDTFLSDFSSPSGKSGEACGREGFLPSHLER